MASFTAMSSARMRCASSTRQALVVEIFSSSAALRRSDSSNTARIRLTAQNRFTAVGRVLEMVSATVSNSARSSVSVLATEFFIPSAIPIAAATPIAGAPRITMERMASATPR